MGAALFGRWDDVGLQCQLHRAKMSASPTHSREGNLSMESAADFIDKKIDALDDWRGSTLAKMRKLIHKADPEILEEVKWRGTPVFFHAGIVCTGETYKSVVKLTFAKGASLADPSRLFNSSLEGNVRRAIDIHEGEKLNEAAFIALIRAAVQLNVETKGKSSKASSKPAA
jgi:hypothetical protein